MGEYHDLFTSTSTSKAGGSLINYDKIKGNQKEALYANFEALGLDAAVFTAGKSGKIPYGQLKKYFREREDETVKPSSEDNNPKLEDLQYFYHPDHLGSSAYVTDVDGEVHQHHEYFPFGETFIDERPGKDDAVNYQTGSPYLFNGKELDEETGLYYYGARYYDARISMWYGVDPLAEKYFSLSPYVYVSNNPMKYIDPDGRTITDPKSKAKANHMQKGLEMRAAFLNTQKELIYIAATNKNNEVSLNKAQRKQLKELSSMISEVKQSIKDINDMISDNKNDYKFESGNIPITKRTGENEVTMYSDGYSSQVHEVRHGGQIARGEMDIDLSGNLISGSYGASKEISAYRAQFSAVGEIKYEPYRDYSDFSNLQKIGQKETVQNLDQINNGFLQNLVDKPGLNQTNIYPESNTEFYEK